MNCAGLMWAGNEELDSPCHDSLPDPADRDDWRNKTPQDTGDGNQTNEDWIWFTESVMIEQHGWYVLDISKSGNGTVTPGVGKHTYIEGRLVELNAVPGYGWAFTGWTGSGTPAIANPGSPNTTITMNADYSITANFAEADGAIAELIAPGATMHLNSGQNYVVTAKLENNTGATLTELYARIYAKQAGSPDGPDPNIGLLGQDGGWDFDADGDSTIENDDGTAGTPDDGTADDEGTGDNAWPWVNTDDYDYDNWTDIKPALNSGSLVNDCGPLLGAMGNGEYSNDFCSFNHILLKGDEPHIKQLDPLPAGQAQTVAWSIQCIGDGDVDIRVYFWDEAHEGLISGAVRELDSACHDNLPDPADRDDNNNDGSDYIWQTESVMITQGAEQYTLEVSQSGNGTVTPDVGTHLYTDGQVVELNAEPASGWEFTGWTGSGTPAIDNPGSPNTTITMNGNYSITANFQQNTWSPWDYDANSNGKIGYGEMVDALMDYLTDGISFSQMIDVLMCYLTGGPGYELQISSTEGGCVTTPGEGTFSFYEGAVVTLVADPDPGWHFANWTGSGSPAIANPGSPNTTITMNGDYSITANFAAGSVPATLEMVPIPGGSFQMGDLTEGDGDSDELPVHTVTLSPFEMAQTELTYEQWQAVKAWAESGSYTFNNPGDMGSEDAGGSQDETHPVTDIEWYDAVLWCNALSEMEGRTPCYYTGTPPAAVYRSGRTDIENNWVDWNANGYRLPTEAEWEYACRADTTTKYNVGDTISGSDANYYDSGDSYDNGTTPVGYYPANPWGLYDMHGNVWEWCWDWWDSDYYSSSPGTDPRGPSAGSDRVGRGGSWGDLEGTLRSAFRGDYYPYFDGIVIGFRPVRSSS